VNELNVGDWVLMHFCRRSIKWYVLEVAGDKALLGNPDWCVSASMWWETAHVINSSVYLGAGKIRWWWKFVPHRDLIIPVSEARN